VTSFVVTATAAAAAAAYPVSISIYWLVFSLSVRPMQVVTYAEAYGLLVGLEWKATVQMTAPSRGIHSCRSLSHRHVAHPAARADGQAHEGSVHRCWLSCQL